MLRAPHWPSPAPSRSLTFSDPTGKAQSALQNLLFQETGTHAEEIKIESTTDALEEETDWLRDFAAFKSAAQPVPSHRLRARWIIIFWLIDPFGHRSHGYFFGRKGPQDFFCRLS
jgi:hypothetical protein